MDEQETSKQATQNVKMIEALWNGADVLNQQISNGTVPIFTLQQQLRILATKLTVLRESVAMETASTSQVPFRAVVPTPKGKLIGIIESLKKASSRGNPCSLRSCESIEKEPVAMEMDNNQGVASYVSPVSFRAIPTVPLVSPPEVTVVPPTSPPEVTPVSPPEMMIVPPVSPPEVTIVPPISPPEVTPISPPEVTPVSPPEVTIVPPISPPEVPPPPPALPCTNQSLIQRPSNYTPITTTPLKPLYWKRLQYTSLELTKMDIVWKNISEPELLDRNNFEQLFARKVTKTSLTCTKSVAKQQSCHQPIRLLDGHRSQVLGILLNSLHIEIVDVKQAVMNFDLETCEQETLQTIADVLPTSQELAAIKAHLHDNSNAPLDKPEMFLYQLSEIPQFTSRLACVLFTSTFAESATSIQSKLTTLHKICDSLNHSQQVHNVLGVVLAFGNAMNSDNKVRGQADGYHLDILCKLKDVKSFDNSTNLLAFIVQYWIQYYDKHAGTIASTFPLPDPSDLFAASQIKFDKLSSNIEELNQQIRVVKCHLDQVLKLSQWQHIQPFKSRMELSHKKAESMLECLTKQLTSVKSDFIRCVNYYNCVPQNKGGQDEVSPEDFFGMWSSFVKDFHEIWKKEQKLVAKKRQKQQQASRIANTPVKPVTNTSLKWRLKMKATVQT